MQNPTDSSVRNDYHLEMGLVLERVWERYECPPLLTPRGKDDSYKAYEMWDEMMRVCMLHLSTRVPPFLQALTRMILSERYYLDGIVSPLSAVVCAHGPIDVTALRVLAHENGVTLYSREAENVQELLSRLYRDVGKLVDEGRLTLSPITEPYPVPFDLAIWIQPTMREEKVERDSLEFDPYPQTPFSGDVKGYLTPDMLVENISPGGYLLIQTNAPIQFVNPFLDRDNMKLIWRTFDISLTNYLFPGIQLFRSHGEVALFKIVHQGVTH